MAAVFCSISSIAFSRFNTCSLSGENTHLARSLLSLSLGGKNINRFSHVQATNCLNTPESFTK